MSTDVAVLTLSGRKFYADGPTTKKVVMKIYSGSMNDEVVVSC